MSDRLYAEANALCQIINRGQNKICKPIRGYRTNGCLFRATRSVGFLRSTPTNRTHATTDCLFVTPGLRGAPTNERVSTSLLWVHDWPARKEKRISQIDRRPDQRRRFLAQTSCTYWMSGRSARSELESQPGRRDNRRSIQNAAISSFSSINLRTHTITLQFVTLLRWHQYRAGSKHFWPAHLRPWFLWLHQAAHARHLTQLQSNPLRSIMTLLV